MPICYHLWPACCCCKSQHFWTWVALAPATAPHLLLLLPVLSAGGKVVYFGDHGAACINYFKQSDLPGITAELKPNREAEWLVDVVTSAGES